MHHSATLESNVAPCGSRWLRRLHWRVDDGKWESTGGPTACGACSRRHHWTRPSRVRRRREYPAVSRNGSISGGSGSERRSQQLSRRWRWMEVAPSPGKRSKRVWRPQKARSNTLHRESEPPSHVKNPPSTVQSIVISLTPTHTTRSDTTGKRAHLDRARQEPLVDLPSSLQRALECVSTQANDTFPSGSG